MDVAPNSELDIAVHLVCMKPGHNRLPMLQFSGWFSEQKINLSGSEAFLTQKTVLIRSAGLLSKSQVHAI